jgi:hypothetical protein
MVVLLTTVSAIEGSTEIRFSMTPVQFVLASTAMRLYLVKETNLMC